MELASNNKEQEREPGLKSVSNDNSTKCTDIIPSNEETTETNESCSNKSCAGVFNFPQKLLNCDNITLYCKYAVVKNDAPYAVAYKNKVPQIISKQCNDIGIWRGVSLGWKCNDCYSLFQKKT